LDTSKINKIILLDLAKKEITVEPGIIRDELNRFLEPHNLFFSPITSTANRATIGGMVGNNSSGTTSIKYGVTRDKVIALKTILHDGSEVTFEDIDKNELDEKLKLESLEGDIYRFFYEKFSTPSLLHLIEKEAPSQDIHRRNTGYAVDEIVNMQPFSPDGNSFNLAKLIAGSEGTLCIIKEVTLALDKTPPSLVTVVATHCNSIKDALLSTQLAMKFDPYKCEFMDKIILDCTKENIDQLDNRFFISGAPKAVLMVEFRHDTEQELKEQVAEYIKTVDLAKLSFHHSLIHNEETSKVWNLRSAGLGLLANIPGDKKAVACVEDTAVSINKLPEYIEEFTTLMEGYNQKAVYYAHAGAGEIHLRPVLNLKLKEDRELFYNITKDTAHLVKKYKGSLSGEHGDGRVRAPFIPIMVGDQIQQLFIEIKQLFDPHNIFNPGKIVHPKSMLDDLRTDYSEEIHLNTIYDFLPEGGFLRAVEKCNGSGDCRKLPEENGTMCPSFHATRSEHDTTRARANMLREYMTEGGVSVNAHEVKSVLDLCISCKACKSECPSGVDMSAMKAEFTYQYYEEFGIPFRDKAFANISRIHKMFQFSPALHNLGLTQKIISTSLKKMLGIAKKRSIPKLYKSLLSWDQNRKKEVKDGGELYVYVDEFTNYIDTPIGKKAIVLLEDLGYNPILLKHPSSGRAELSKGFLKKAKKIAEENIDFWKGKISEGKPLVGIEPSAILGFRDEYLRLVDEELLAEAKKIAKYTFTIEEFIANEYKANRIKSKQFVSSKKSIHLHVHCHQKALSKIEYSVACLSIPNGFHVELIPSGCCGMAGSFGYEKEHYEISMKIGEQILFPAIRKSEADYIAAAGTSCRHQIKDGTDKESMHPIEILYDSILRK
jgi:FAD/FMN-containing dehydrogenase/Fe-S oxidoreductase